GTGRNVYLIRQNIDRLYGEYLVTAVVIATGPGQAIKNLLRHIRAHRPETLARRSRLTVVQIGEHAPERLDLHTADGPVDGATVVAVVYGEDNDV
ncbi:MAG TPA: hypothetical protein VEL76_39450, partial [Gemmataceae bacterium]|nr:hypothetical protein [Gemmataceae bacterium]